MISRAGHVNIRNSLSSSTQQRTFRGNCQPSEVAVRTIDRPKAALPTSVVVTSARCKGAVSDGSGPATELLQVGVEALTAQGLTDPVAIQLKHQGDSAIESGAFEAALGSYSKALLIEPSPALQYNRGRALQALGRNSEALDEFEQFESTASTELKAAVPDLEEMIAAVRHQVAEVSVKCDVPGARLHVKGKALAPPACADILPRELKYIAERKPRQLWRRRLA